MDETNIVPDPIGFTTLRIENLAAEYAIKMAYEYAIYGVDGKPESIGQYAMHGLKIICDRDYQSRKNRYVITPEDVMSVDAFFSNLIVSTEFTDVPALIDNPVLRRIQVTQDAEHVIFPKMEVIQPECLPFSLEHLVTLRDYFAAKAGFYGYSFYENLKLEKKVDEVLFDVMNYGSQEVHDVFEIFHRMHWAYGHAD